nr:hypothetical protein [Solirubrobacterales bacterium]
VLDTLLAWDGDYHRTDGAGTVDPGVAAWTAFRAEAARHALAPLGPGARLLLGETDLDPLYGAYVHAAPYHFFEATHPESYALRTLSPAGYRAAAAAAADRLRERFATDDPARWREPRRMYDIALSGAASPPPLPFFDRGTFEQFVELGP